MSRTKLIAALVGLAAIALVGTPTATAEPRQAVRTIYYDASRAAELAPLVDQAAQIWNTGVTSVRLAKGTGGVSVSTAQNGPAPGMASCVGCTRGTITFYRNQITQSGAGPLRVVVHEFGHILGLNHPSDIGNCDKVMAGGRCDNAQPNAQELAAVQRFWSRGFAGVVPGGGVDDSRIFDVPALVGA
ncbi:snapalysin family zinc-dependent metalloprotease [Saccharothrix obliqua]|uniref:snapalysin family zinc-dependent metalloprotease n=1 Tax=Saccharothrix obliqua TaxID=2861747 RepID=UPI001C5E68DE|nr:snapalysin family zinc-dependent metalloprotease [Saccharothrix obliqua]MBW4718062.1 snapalysin family zinc-dependent metalloprotease [Saccharothrix obliqua]